MGGALTKTEADDTQRLLDWLASVKDDPIAFAYGAFPWGEEGTVLEHSVLDPWQIGILQALKDGLLNVEEAIQLAVASGHGIGKSALVAIIILWAFTTAPDTRGVVTANTETQLKTKTWSELGKWFNLFIGKDHFNLTATALLSKDPARERTWRIDMVPWSEKNTEAFAGLHNKLKRLILIMDEASAIPDLIWEVAEGALTDASTQIIWLAFGNPTRNTGRFRECFSGGKFSKYWKTRQIDSRTVAITNKKQFDRWIETYGEDSDFVRVRVRGIFPRHGEMEFISAAAVDAAMTREVTSAITDPLAHGIDVARFGSNESVEAFRKGRDARTIPWRFYRGLDTVELAAKIAGSNAEYRTDGIFIDGGGVGGGVVDNVRRLHLHCFDVQFGSKDDVGGGVWGIDGERYANKRAAMWGALRAWLKVGAIPSDPDLKAQLIGPTYTYNNRGEIQLESKEDMMSRGVDSPDRADALALTFAYPISTHAMAGGLHQSGKPPTAEYEYDPYAAERMSA
jgi:hypothetical protein